MTLQQCIALYEARTAAQRPSAVLTPLGQATVSAIRLRYLLADLSPEATAAVRELLTNDPQPIA